MNLPAVSLASGIAMISPCFTLESSVMLVVTNGTRTSSRTSADAELLPDSISGTVSALFRRLKLPKGASLHSLRHTHGSHLLAAGMELPAVSARLGRSTTYVTATVYAHALSGRDDEAARIWDKFQNQRSEKRVEKIV
jgi:integrase